ncbi:MAG TPA: cytochrome P450 [Acidimicrobiales bacterium]|nr:cytochrome P450 [Acidimicrobiales bacterium]
MTAAPIDLLSPSAFADGQPWAQFRWLRAHDPVHRHPEPDGRGFWAVTRYHDVHTVSRDPRTFSSWAGGVMLPDGDPGQLEAARRMMLYMDAPDHTRHRRLVSPGFTPRAAERWAERIRALATRIVDAVEAQGGCDFVADVAGEMPSLVVAELMGIPDDDARRLYHLTEVMHSADPALTDEQRVGAMVEMLTYGAGVAAAKRHAPADDLVTVLVRSTIDGEALSDDDLMWFFLLLVNAGGDTTRNLVAGGVEALMAEPAQWEALRHDPDGLMPAAVEELLRFVSPVVHMRRTATADTVLAGQPIAEGDKVVVFYGSANRDEAVFGADAERLDLRRDPNPHVAFGGGGPHFCLGAHIARLEIASLLREVVTRLPGLRLDGPVERLTSTFIAGPKRMPVAW